MDKENRLLLGLAVTVVLYFGMLLWIAEYIITR